MPHDFAAYRAFLEENIQLSPAQFVLKYNGKLNLEIALLAQQLKGLQIARKKLPFLCQNPKVLFPPSLNLEQCSSQITAQYKAELLNGQTAADLTGGFGVDSFFLSQKFKYFHYCETNVELAEMVQQNFASLGIKNVQFHFKNGLEWLRQQTEKIDWIYLDPSRRSNMQKRVFRLADCEPNLIESLDGILQKSNHVLLKAAPLLDISQAISQLKHVHTIHVLSFKNDCKELLFEIGSTAESNPKVKTVNFLANEKRECFDFALHQEAKCQAAIGAAQKYLYEPNVAILKAGAFNLIAESFGLTKLHVNTHLYTSQVKFENFPGRVFEVVERDTNQVNVICRNHPLTEQQIRKKYKLKSGVGNDFLLAFTDVEKPKTLFAKLLK